MNHLLFFCHKHGSCLRVKRIKVEPQLKPRRRPPAMHTAPCKVSSYRTVESPRNKRLIIAQPSAELKQGAHQHYLSGFSPSQNNLLKISCTVSATPPNNVFSQHRSLPDPHSSGSPGGARSPAGSRHGSSLPGFHPVCRHWAVEDRAEGKLGPDPSLPQTSRQMPAG